MRSASARRVSARGLRVSLALGVLAVSASVGPGGRVSAQIDPDRAVEIKGSGTGMVDGFMTAWTNAVYTSAGGGTQVSYSARGSKAGRSDWSSGSEDFAITGRPLTDADKAALTTRGVTAIEAPIAVSAIAFMISSGYPNPMTLIIPGATEDDVPTIRPWPMDQPVKFPNELIGRIFLDKVSPLANEPTFTAQIPTLARPSGYPAGVEQLQVVSAPGPVVRSDPGATDYYLQQFIRTAAPAAWAAKSKEYGVNTSVVTEAWPFILTASRSGNAGVAGVISGWFDPSNSNFTKGGTMGPVSPSAAQREQGIQNLNPDPASRTPLYIASIQNSKGTWVTPTTASISSAALAGNGKPLYGLTETDAPADAYPLTWISSIEVPSSGLSIDKTTAIATFIRYAVTTGQDSAVTLTEGRLPPTLAAQALTAANDVVAGNCVGSDRKVIKAGDGGSFWPSGVAPLAGGVFVCVKVASAGTAVPTAVVDNALVTSPNNTSVQTPSVRPPVAASVAPSSPIPGGSRVGPAYSPSVTPGDSSDVPVLTPDVSTPDSAGAATEAAAAPTTKAAELAAVSLALPLPDDGRNGLDRLTTMLLGGVAFVIVRSIFRRTRVVA